MGKVFVESVKKGASDVALRIQIESVFLKATDNVKWLKKGDVVLLKPAINSPDEYPATTHPLAVQVIYDILKKRGAKVIVGDQSGIEYVLHNESGVVFGSTRDNFHRSKMGGSDIGFVQFEDGDWNKDFFHFKSRKTRSWKNGFYLTNILNKVDHVVNLPRVSTHVMSGVTLGMKNLVGLLREDSRIEFHQDGPFKFAINDVAKKGKMKIDYPDEDKFIEKIVEIGLAVKGKLRLNFFVATEAQTTFGPDGRIVSIFRSHVSRPDEGLVFASSDIVASDVFALGFLRYLREYETPSFRKFFERIISRSAARYHDFDRSVYDNAFIRHAVEIGLGKGKVRVDWGSVSDELKGKLKAEIGM